MSLISAGSISLDSAFKYKYYCIHHQLELTLNSQFMRRPFPAPILQQSWAGRDSQVQYATIWSSTLASVSVVVYVACKVGVKTLLSVGRT
jgi:hypothetical protein